LQVQLLAAFLLALVLLQVDISRTISLWT
jgi:hypothetical protein